MPEKQSAKASTCSLARKFNKIKLLFQKLSMALEPIALNHLPAAVIHHQLNPAHSEQQASWSFSPKPCQAKAAILNLPKRLSQYLALLSEHSQHCENSFEHWKEAEKLEECTVPTRKLVDFLCTSVR